MSPSSVISLSFVVSMLASLGLVFVYVTGGDTQAEGVLLGFALGGMGLGIAVWATSLLNVPEEVEERHELAIPPEEEAALGASPTSDALTRRKLLVRLLAGAGSALAAALAIPSLSLGPSPGRDLFRSGWRKGDPVVDQQGNRMRPRDIPVEGIVTVFPEGRLHESDTQTVLVRVDPSLLELPEGRSEWAPEGTIAYSKLCTHVGCPVGLYRSEAQQLLCPCHQSTFDVLRGAVPLFGPAARPLPQLPLALDENGYLVAMGDFSGPVGPSFWNITSAEGDA